MTATESADVGQQAPPHDIEAEQIALGALLMEDERALAEIAEALDVGDLYRPAHQMVLEVVLALADQGAPVTPVSVNDELGRRGQSAQTGGAAYLHTLVQAVPTAANGGYYARIVADQARLRRIAAAGTRAAQLGYTGTGEVEDIAERALAEMERAVARGESATEDTTLLGDALTEFITELERPEDPERVVVPPYRDLAEVVPVLRPGELVTVAGRTGMGKSVLALDTARHTAIRMGKPTLLVSLEMPVPLLMRRILAAEARVPANALARKELSDAHWQALASAMGRVRDAPLHLSTPASCTLGLIRARLRAMARRDPARLLVVDHVGLMSSATRPENRQNEIAAYSRGLKQIAMEFDIPVMMVSQVNRSPESREDRVPRLGDLRDSGSLEQDSDAVLLVYRPDYYDPEDPRAGEVDVVVAKNRSGSTSTVPLAHQLHYQRFVDMIHDPSERA